MSVKVCQRCHNKFQSHEGREAQNWVLGGLTSYSTHEWYCNSCVGTVEKEMRAAKKAAKKAEKAERASCDDSCSCGGGSSSDDEPMLPSGCAKYFYAILIFLGFIVLLAAIFGEGPENVNDKDQMMKKWAEHLEKRCDAFAEGISADGVDERGLKGYSWDEWMEFKKNGQGKPEEKPATAKPAKIELPTPGAKDVAQNTTWSDVQFTVDERIVTVTSEYDTREAAWREAISTAVETAVINFVSDSSLLNANRRRLKERLKTVDKTDIKKLDILKDELSGKVFTVKIRAVFDKKSLTPRFKDIYPTCFKEEAATPAVAQPVPNTSATPSRRTSQQSATPAVTQVAPKTSASPSTRTTPQPVKSATPKVSSPVSASAPAVRPTKPEPTLVKPASAAVNSEQKASVNGDVKSSGQRASTESKGISITVDAKGKTEKMALRNAFREAVFKTAGTWVGSKERFKENREKVIEQVKTVTEADIGKYEVLETSQEADGTYAVKVKVSVSKKKIAPKLAPVFPDVFDVE